MVLLSEIQIIRQQKVSPPLPYNTKICFFVMSAKMQTTTTTVPSSIPSIEIVQGQPVMDEEGLSAEALSPPPPPSAMYVQLDDGTEVLCHIINVNELIIAHHTAGDDEIIPNYDPSSPPLTIADPANNIDNDGCAASPTTHHEKITYKCDLCQRQYSSRNSLKTHQRSHSGERPYKCETCQNSFNTRYTLNIHMRRHTGDKPFKCPAANCGKAFKASSDLATHHRTHTGIRPFACTFTGCTQSFTTIGARNVHLRTHTGERPFRCEFEGCERTFNNMTNRNNHQRVHTGARPFQCTICQRSFAEYSTLYKHRQVHKSTASDVIECPLCDKAYRKVWIFLFLIFFF